MILSSAGSAANIKAGRQKPLLCFMQGSDGRKFARYCGAGRQGGYIISARIPDFAAKRI